MTADEARYQIIEGPPEVMGLHSHAALLSLLQAGTLPAWVTVLDTQTLQTCPAGDFCPDTATGPTDAKPNGEAPQAALPEADQLDGLRLGAVLERQTGQGGAEEVLQEATRIADGRSLHLRLFAPMQDRARREAFLQTCATLAGIRNRHLLLPVQHGLHEDRPWWACEVPEGTRLDTWLQQHAAPETETIVCWLGALADGLWALAKEGLVHRALDPARILVRRGGDLAIDALAMAAVQTTPTPGDLAYRSPELLRGEAADHRSDLFSLGVLLYRLISGRLPFAGHEARELLEAQRSPPPLPDSASGGLPGPLLELTMRLLAVDPSLRPHSARDLQQAVAAPKAQRRRSSAQLPAIESPLPGHAATIPSRRSSVVLAGRSAPRRSLLPWLCLLLLLAAAAGGWWWWQEQQASERALAPFSTMMPDQHAPAAEVDRIATEAAPAAATTPAAADAATPIADPTTEPAQRTMLLARWQEAQATDDHEAAWQAARRLIESHPTELTSMRLRLPLQIETEAETIVLYDGRRQAQERPLLLQLPPGSDGELIAWAPERRPQLARLGPLLASSWRWQPTLEALPGLRWLASLPANPVGDAIPLRRGAALPLADGSLALVDGDGRVQIITGVLRARPFDHAVREDLLVLASASELILVDLARSRVRSRLPAASQDPFVHGIALADHELMPGEHRLWALSASGLLRCWTLREGREIPQADTRLPDRPSAALRVLPLDAALSAVLVPCGQTLAVFDGGSLGQQRPCRLLGQASLGQLAGPAIPLWFEQQALLLAVDVRGGLGSLGLPELERRGNWLLAAAPQHPMQVLPGGKVLAALRHQGLRLIDPLRGPLWRSEDRAPAGGWAGPTRILGDQLLATGADGSLLLLASTDGRTIRRIPVGLKPAGAAAVHDGTALLPLADAGAVVGIDLGEGP